MSYPPPHCIHGDKLPCLTQQLSPDTAPFPGSPQLHCTYQARVHYGTKAVGGARGGAWGRDQYVAEAGEGLVMEVLCSLVSMPSPSFYCLQYGSLSHLNILQAMGSWVRAWE